MTQATALSGDRAARARGAVRHALREFLVVPALVTLGFVVLAVITIVLDQLHASWLEPMRHAAGHLVGKSAAQSALSAIATGVVTVTSITFSVLLLAVQQTASSLSPVVFDQFLRRRVNQVYLGFFVGLALYSYLVLAAVQNKTPPILGATVAVLLTALALLFLLVLVYSTINQMRPTNVIATMRHEALRAHERERDVIRRTRRTSELTDRVTATYHAEAAGYVTRVDLDRVVAAIEGRDRCEVDLRVSVGDFIACGDPVATVKDGDEAYARHIADEVKRAIAISRSPDLDRDATTAVVELANIAWTSISSAKHNPVVGQQAMNALRDLLGRWERDRAQPPPGPEDVLPIVYADTDHTVLFDTFFSLLVAAGESRQHQTVARVLEAYAAVLPQLTDAGRERLVRDLGRADDMVAQHPASVQLERAMDTLREALCDTGERPAADRLARVWDRMSGSEEGASLRGAGAL